MKMEGKIRKIGKSMGVILPEQLIEELHLKTGDTVSIKRKGSSLEIRPIDPDSKECAEAYRQLNTDYKDVLKALAE